MVKSKKKRKSFLTVHVTIEGIKRERNFLKILQNLYHDNQKVKLAFNPKNGGNPNALLDSALRYISFGYDKMYIWIDEDIDLNQDSREKLYRHWRVEDKDRFYACPLGELQSRYNSTLRNPVLIVSQPISVESLIIRSLGTNLPHQQLNLDILADQKRDLKSSLEGIIGLEDEYECLSAKLTKDLLEEKRISVPELELLISMLSDNE